MQKDGPNISEIRIVTLSVKDLEQSVTFYREALNYTEVGRGVIGQELSGLWRIPAGMTGTQAVMAAEGKEAGVLRLVQFDTPGELFFTKQEDHGHYIVNFRGKDVRGLWPKLLKAGAGVKSPPTYWKLKHNVWDTIVYDPSGILLDIFEIECEPDDPIGQQVTEVSEVVTMAMHVADARRSQAFYQGLGFVVYYEKLVENMEEFTGFPKGSKFLNVNLKRPTGSPNGRIELAENIGIHGKSLRDKAVPPNIGILSISLETDDLDATCRLAEGLGGEKVSDPINTTFPFFGGVTCAMYFGPDGEAIEFFQRD
jgi:catechol 2,3-dioxygenase-like lactoylglutathione lyase family enzyme